MDPRFDPVLLIFMTGGVLLSVLTDRLIFLSVGPVFLVCRVGLERISFIYYLLLFAIPFSTEIQLTPSLGTDFPDEPLMWLLSFLLLVDFLLHRDEWRRRWVDPQIAGLLFLHLAWIFITAVLSQHLVLSLKFMAAKIWYVVAFTIGTWYCLRTRRDIIRAASLMMASMFLASCYVMIQHYKFGFGFETANLSVEPLFRNHVNYGALLVCLMPLPIAGSILFKRYRPALIFLFIFWLIALFLTYSRGAWAAGIAGMATFLAMRFRILGIVAVFMVMMTFTALYHLGSDNRYLDYRPNYERTIFHQDFSEHMRATYDGTDLSTVERFHRWIAAFRMIPGHELLGYGPNSYYHEYRPYTVSAFRTYVSDNPERSTVHNYFLLVVVEQGIPGLVVFCLLLLKLFLISAKWYRQSTAVATRIIAGSVIAMLGMIIFLNLMSDLIETDKIGSLFFMCIGILLRSREAPDPRSV